MPTTAAAGMRIWVRSSERIVMAALVISLAELRVRVRELSQARERRRLWRRSGARVPFYGAEWGRDAG